MAYRCNVCGKEYQSRSGLWRHMKAKHPSTGLRTGRVAVPALPVQAPAEASLEAALEALGIDEEDVLAYKVYHEPLKVVIIEGPVGYKRVWCHGE